MVRYSPQESQYAYQVCKSTETTLHSPEEEQYALAVFMNISGHLIQSHLQFRKPWKDAMCIKKMMKWITNKLRCRNFYLTFQDSSAEVDVVKGCHQGGVLSPVL